MTRPAILSESLAVLIIDALVDGQIIAKADFESGVKIGKSTINSRKALGDYYDGSASASVDLGMLIINNLIGAKIIEQSLFNTGVEIAQEEIDARKWVGDYDR